MNSYSYIDSPVGRLLLCSDGETLTGLYMDTPRHAQRDLPHWQKDAGGGVLSTAARQLEEYFAGERRAFDLVLRPGGTEFQRRVWKALTEIPYGETVSYAELAQRIDNPNACRAVGLANGRNPISILVPVHRVIGSDGSLTGYAGGVDRKRWLLAHEELHRQTGPRTCGLKPAAADLRSPSPYAECLRRGGYPGNFH